MCVCVVRVLPASVHLIQLCIHESERSMAGEYDCRPTSCICMHIARKEATLLVVALRCAPRYSAAESRCLSPPPPPWPAPCPAPSLSLGAAAVAAQEREKCRSQMALMGLLPRMGLLVSLTGVRLLGSFCMRPIRCSCMQQQMKAFLWASDFPGSLSVSYVCLRAGTNFCSTPFPNPVANIAHGLV